ncbi:DUF2332 domain-containing protein [Rhodosalinus sp. K401]|uniref:DUF2332 domain-containing protein n=1 Tax=Rhodosalinus sp. K401 TaxID=3239195 RepID=UPI0035263C8E
MSVPGAFRSQARACDRLGSPFMARLLDTLAAGWDETSALGRRFAAWEGDIGPAGASLPLRLAGGLHALCLSARAPSLAAVYPPAQAGEAALARALAETLATHEPFLLDWIDRAPQTNEIRRSAVLIAAAHWLAERHPLPLVLSELGASGGLNLNFDRFALDLGTRRYGPAGPVLTLAPDWDGPPPPDAPIRVTERRGVDVAPLNPGRTDDALRLLAYLWPDQPERLARTRAVIAAHDATVDAADAADWLEARLARARPGRLHLVYHTIAWQYFPRATQARATAVLEAAGARAGEDAPLAWLSMETDGRPDGAALALRLWPGDRRQALGRADFHGRWVRWDGPARLA